MTWAVILIKIGIVNEFAVFIKTIITEHDFKTEYFFRMCSTATDLITSLEYDPIRCASTLCHFRRTRNAYVATHFILLNSTVESSATSGSVVVPERFDQNEEPAVKMRNGLRKA